MADDIRFGTSGWRGLIARDFTFENARRLTLAIGKYLRQSASKPAARRGIFVAHDYRFLAEEFAQESALVLAAQGHRVLLAPEATPTPAVSAFVLAKKLAGAINFTASHNPPEWQGMKFTSAEGLPSPKSATKVIEGLIPASSEFGKRSAKSPFRIESISARGAYFAALRRVIDFAAIRRARARVAYDAMHGAGAAWLDGILREEGIPCEALHVERDVLFGGGMPDPTEARLGDLSRAVRRRRNALGLATDGDADRFGILDERGRYVPPNLVIAMLCDYVLRRGGKGDLARSVVTTRMVDDVARLHGVTTVHETPVGFKYIGDCFLRGAVVGGEESSGFSAAAHVPEKDGIFTGLLALEMTARSGKPFSALVQDFYKRIGGRRVNARRDIRVSLARLPEIRGNTFAGLKLLGKNHVDGVKWEFEGGAWLAMRPSGTEPLVRVYAEARDGKTLERLLDAGEKLIRKG